MTESNGQLKAIIERIERLEDEKAALAEDIKEVFAEAKGNGFNVPSIKILLADRKLERDEAKKRKSDEAH
jgi:uncharacterized protein (UPF0335 family)